MSRMLLGGILASVLIVAMLAAVPSVAQVQSADEFIALNWQVEQLYREGKYAEATAIAERVLPLAEASLGREHLETLNVIEALADLYQAQDRYNEAEPLFKRALEARVRVQGKDHPDTLTAIDNLAMLYGNQGDYDKAEPLFLQALGGREQVLGREHPDTLESVNNLAVLYQAQSRYGEAEPLYRHVLETRASVLGTEHPDTLTSVNNLAALYEAWSRYSQAGPLYQRVLTARERALGPKHPTTLVSANNLAQLYQAQGRYGEAEPLFQRALEGCEQVLGKEHPDTLTSVNNLALLYRNQGRYGEAELLYLRALEAKERTLGKEHPSTLTSIGNLGALYFAQGRYRDAEPLYMRVMEVSERTLGKEHPDTFLGANNLALLYKAQGRYAEAEPLYQRVLKGHEGDLGPEHPSTLTSVNNLAQLYQAQGRYGEAEPLFLRALQMCERVLGDEHPLTLTSVSNLGGLYFSQGRYAEAEPLFRRALQFRERMQGKEHPDTLVNVNNLAELYRIQGRHAQAEPLFRRALDASERLLGTSHPLTLLSGSNLALLYDTQSRYSEAKPLYVRALQIREQVLGKKHPDTLASLNNLALHHFIQGRYDEAEPLYQRTFQASEEVLGKEHPDTLRSINNLALLYQAQGRYREAEPLYLRVVEASERVLGKEHPNTLNSLSNLAGLYFEQSDWNRATAFWRQSTAALSRRSQLGAKDTRGETLAGKKKSEAEQSDWQFSIFVKAVSRLSAKNQHPDPQAADEMFRAAQWAVGSETARSLAQMAARGAKGDPELAALVRERQDLVAEWQRRDALQDRWLGQAPGRRNAEAEAGSTARLASIDARVATIDKRLTEAFPDYAALISPEPLSLEVVQAHLGTDEALVLFLDTANAGPASEETFLWAVTKTDARWVRSDLGTTALTRDVKALRCGLDEEEWARPTSAARCRDLLKLTGMQGPSRPLPFDLDKAYAVYRALFGQIEDLINGKHLLIVPSGPLTQLPFQVLVTAPPVSGNYRSAAWLARDHALTVLPAVSSLKALRRVARPSGAAKPMIGFGNPLLDGLDSRYAGLARRARDNERCRDGSSRQTVELIGVRGVAPMETSGGLANIAQIRMQMPLPETADELCAVADDLRADVKEMRLGARATEREVKMLSTSGQLADYRIVHFATHGAMAGELSGTAEPGLLLTPPAEASVEDDGYLSASEIAGLKLDADWVILSACNTAAGDARGAQALSGLARAFFYAQARALLVSHWAVNSEATVKLITRAIREISQDARVGRAEALRRAMLALVDNGTPQEAHPALWAPFVLVGEGGR